MESEEVKEIKEKLQEEIFIANSFGDKLRKVPTKELENILTLINELESENERLLESCKNCHYIKDLEIANGHAKELKERIAELEKEKTEQLKQFAERLKEKKTKRLFTKSQMNMAISNTVGMLGNLLKEGLSKEIVYVFISEAKKLEVNGSIKITDLEKLGEEITKRIVSVNDKV